MEIKEKERVKKMTTLKVSLAQINYGLQETRVNPLWFTSDYSIHLSHNSHLSEEVNLENLSERSLLELKAASKLGLIEIDKTAVFYTFLAMRN